MVRDSFPLRPTHRRRLHRTARAEHRQTAERSRAGRRRDRKGALPESRHSVRAALRLRLRPEGQPEPDGPRRRRHVLRPSAGQRGVRPADQSADHAAADLLLRPDADHQHRARCCWRLRRWWRTTAAASRPRRTPSTSASRPSCRSIPCSTSPTSARWARTCCSAATSTPRTTAPPTSRATRIRPLAANSTGANALPVDFLRPYQGFGNISYIEPASSSNYHSLQTSLNRRFKKGLLLGVTYTWSKALGTQGSGPAGHQQLRRSAHRHQQPAGQLRPAGFRPPPQFQRQLGVRTPQGDAGTAASA